MSVHYSAAPFDFEGEAFIEKGLQETLDRVAVMWGGEPRKEAAARPALSFGGGAALVSTEAGRVLIRRDNEADKKENRALETEADGRLKTYWAKVAIGRLSGRIDEDAGSIDITGEGLLDLFYKAAMFVQDKLGDVPESMGRDEIEKRLPSVRSQLARAKTSDREGTAIAFPNSMKGSFFEIRGAHYYVVVYVYTEEPMTPAKMFGKAPRRE